MSRSKKDVRRDTHVVWDAYINKAPEDALKLIYEDAQKSSLEKRDWYWSAIRIKKIASKYSRLLAFLLLVLATALPLLAGLSDEPKVRLLCTQIGIVLLAIAGLTQVADKTFGWSSGWMRYISTVTSMESKTTSFELIWAKHFLSKPSEVNSSDVQTLFSMAERFEQDLIQLQVDETNGWITEFNAGLNVLYTAIEAQRKNTKKELDKIRAVANKAQSEAKAQQPGSIELYLKFIDKPKAVNLFLNGELLKEAPSGTTWPLTNITPGIHSIIIQDPQNTNLQAGRSATVEAGKTTEVEVLLPF